MKKRQVKLDCCCVHKDVDDLYAYDATTHKVTCNVQSTRECQQQAVDLMFARITGWGSVARLRTTANYHGEERVRVKRN